MNNLEKLTDLDTMADMICRQNIDSLEDKSCKSMQSKNGGGCPYGDNGPDDFTDCIQCHKVWLLEEAVD